MDQAEAVGVLVALSKGGGVPYQETVKAGRLVANSLRDSGIEAVMYSEKPWSGVWPLTSTGTTTGSAARRSAELVDAATDTPLDRLADEEAATFALKFATQIEAVLAVS
jgi:hypothetical protein